MNKYTKCIKEIMEAMYSDEARSLDALAIFKRVDVALSNHGYSPENIERIKPEDQIVLVWDVDDVKGDNDEVWPDMTDNVARYILDTAEHQHDCNTGMSWEVIEVVMNNLLFDVKLKAAKASDYSSVLISDTEAQDIITKLCETHTGGAKCLDRDEMDKLIQEWVDNIQVGDYVIYRAAGGISLNGKEYVLTDEGNLRRFETKEEIFELLEINNEEEMEETGASIGIYDEEFPKD